MLRRMARLKLKKWNVQITVKEDLSQEYLTKIETPYFFYFFIKGS